MPTAYVDCLNSALDPTYGLAERIERPILTEVAHYSSGCQLWDV